MHSCYDLPPFSRVPRQLTQYSNFLNCEPREVFSLEMHSFGHSDIVKLTSTCTLFWDSLGWPMMSHRQLQSSVSITDDQSLSRESLFLEVGTLLSLLLFSGEAVCVTLLAVLVGFVNGTHIWESPLRTASIRLTCTQVSSARSWLVTDVGDSSSPWTVTPLWAVTPLGKSPCMYNKAGWASQ